MPQRKANRTFACFLTALIAVTTALFAHTCRAATQTPPIAWGGIDIGDVKPAGTDILGGAGFTINSTGNAIGIQTQDRFHFVYQAVTGDCILMARVEIAIVERMEILQGAPTDAQAGLMVRDALADTSDFAAVAVDTRGASYTPRRNPGTLYDASQSRPAGARGFISSTTSMPTKASWLKLVKRGTEITCYSAFDSGGRPGDWHQAAPPSPVATGLVYVGLYVTGGGAGTSATATFDHVTLSTGNLPALDNGIYTVVPESARALVMDASNTAGAAINSPASPPAAAQRWRITDVGGGLYRLAPDSDPSLCLTVAGAPAANGAKVRLEPDRGQASQRWRILTLGDDRYGLAPAFAPNLRLDDFGGNTTPGFLLDVWELIPNDPHTTWIIRGAE